MFVDVDIHQRTRLNYNIRSEGRNAMAKLSRLQWVTANSVHIEILDDQHRKLFEIANHLMDVFESDSDDLLTVIDGLLNYISVHFRDEHTVMIKAKYPGFMAHSQEHQHFIEKVQEFLSGYRNDDKNLGLNMVVFMKEWIRDHTTGKDLQYAEFLKTLQNGQKKIAQK